MKTRVVIILMVLYILIWNLSFAQRWGKISAEENSITSISEESDADAVFLFEKSDIEITPEFELLIIRHTRIKILTEEGKKYANIKIPYWHGDIISYIKGHTIFPDKKKIKLKETDIFDEKGELWHNKVFTIPGVETGAIIEYKYYIRSKYLSLSPWYFQNSEFTKLSQLSISIPDGFNYKAYYTNLDESVCKPVKEKITNLSWGNRVIYKYIWKMENVSSIKQEPFMTNIKDYLSALYFQFESYSYKDQYHKLASTWKDKAERVRWLYKKFLNRDHGLKEKAMQLVSNVNTDYEKALKIYNFVKDTIGKGPYHWIIGERLVKPDHVLENRKGSDVEKNILLINLLRHAGCTAYPVMISTRDHGKFDLRYVSLQQVNHVIVYFEGNEKAVLLDTKNKWCPFGTLPSDDFVQHGLLISDNDVKQIKIPDLKGFNLSSAETRGILDDKGTLIGKTTLIFNEYRGIEEREELSKKGEKDYINNKMSERFSDFKIDSFFVSEFDDIEKPFKISVYYKLSEYAQVIDKMIYLSPVSFFNHDSNPFKKEKRNFRVDFPYMFSYIDYFDVLIPEGYELIEIPNPVDLKDQFIRYKTECAISKQIIQYSREFLVASLYFTKEEYPELRNFYSKVVNNDQIQLVLSNSDN
jgi:hypothetical protein